MWVKCKAPQMIDLRCFWLNICLLGPYISVKTIVTFCSKLLYTLCPNLQKNIYSDILLTFNNVWTYSFKRTSSWAKLHKWLFWKDWYTLLSHAMEQNLREAASSSARKIHYCVHNSLPMIAILRQIDPDNTPVFYFSKIFLVLFSHLQLLLLNIHFLPGFQFNI
jgi:hypothetical protein